MVGLAFKMASMRMINIQQSKISNGSSLQNGTHKDDKYQFVACPSTLINFSGKF
jgi:hypothetical protein